jgi:hypothetical protein
MVGTKIIINKSGKKIDLEEEEKQERLRVEKEKSQKMLNIKVNKFQSNQLTVKAEKK